MKGVVFTVVQGLIREVRVMAKIISYLKSAFERFFKHDCPGCGGVMDSEFLDMTLDRMVYKCRKCGKRWV